MQSHFSGLLGFLFHEGKASATNRYLERITTLEGVLWTTQFTEHRARKLQIVRSTLSLVGHLSNRLHLLGIIAFVGCWENTGKACTDYELEANLLVR